MNDTYTLTDGQMERLRALSADALANVSRGLTEMFSADMSVVVDQVHAVPLNEVGGLVDDPELEVVVIHLMADGGIPAHLLVLMQVPTAMEMVDVLLEMLPGSTTELGEMEISALGEVGNIVASFFLNSLADSIGMRLDVSPPTVVSDMAGAAVDMALIEVAMFADEAIVMDAKFEYQGHTLPAWFLAFPDPAQLREALSLAVAAGHLGAQR
jgi:chemotaxis protein CheC